MTNNPNMGKFNFIKKRARTHNLNNKGLQVLKINVFINKSINNTSEKNPSSNPKASPHSVAWTSSAPPISTSAPV